MQSLSNRRPAQAGTRLSPRLLLAAAVTVLWSVGSAGPASAQYVTPEPPRTGDATDVQTTPLADSVSSASGGVSGQLARESEPGLPVTGSDVLGLTAIGLGAIAAGGLVLQLRRRATQT